MYAIVYPKPVPVAIFPYFSLLAVPLRAKKPSFTIPLLRLFGVRIPPAINNRIKYLNTCMGAV